MRETKCMCVCVCVCGGGESQAALGIFLCVDYQDLLDPRMSHLLIKQGTVKPIVKTCM